MLTTYRLKDGDKIVATSPADFLHQLHTGSRFDSEGTDEEYMVLPCFHRQPRCFSYRPN